MIYNSVDTIPAKIFFKIIETGDTLLLTDKKIPFGSFDKEEFYKELHENWLKIQEENDKISLNKDAVIELNISSRIESISAKQISVGFAVRALKLDLTNKDTQLIELIKQRNYKFHYENSKNSERAEKQYLLDLERIEKENKTETIRIESLQKQLPEVNENIEKSSFDKAVINYGIIAGAGFIDTNKITLSEYYPLIEIGNQKIKALENE